jgi:hypothetical protein
MIGKFFRISAAFGFVWHFQAQTGSLHQTDASSPDAFCAVMRHNPRPPAPPHPASARQQERQPTCAACPNLAATAVSLSIALCQFRPDSCGVIGFVSQFFFDIGRPQLDEHSRHSSCADDGAVGAQRSLPRIKAHGWIPSHLAVCCMTMRILRAKESWLTGATGQEGQPVPELESLASPRNSINIAAAAAAAAQIATFVPCPLGRARLQGGLM